MRKNTKMLLGVIEKEAIKAKKHLELAQKSAQEISASAALSPSQAGDRYHSQSTADIAKLRYETIIGLKKEIEQKGDNILYSFEGGDVFVVDNPVLVTGFKLISSKSVLGKKLVKEWKK